MTKCTQCGEDKVDALQRAGGVAGLDYLRTHCYGCGHEQIFHGTAAVEKASAIDASNKPTTETEG